MHTTTLFDTNPVSFCLPEDFGVEARKQLVIFNPGFTGTAEKVRPQLEDLAQSGFHALTVDAYEHGRRAVEDSKALVQRIHSNIRTHFWKIMAHTIAEVPAVIDWAVETYGLAPDKVGMGGISMGGDMALSAAGQDPRIQVVACGIATPDWLRPGTCQEVGNPDREAMDGFSQHNPMNHLERYDHCPAIDMQCGADDAMVPPGSAELFARVLKSLYPTDQQDRVRAVLQADTKHAYTDAMWAENLAWFQRWM